MDSPSFFTGSIAWGKVIGAFLGFLMAGPMGCFIGLLIGNFFDRGLHEHLSNPCLAYHREKSPTVKALFVEATFSVLGCLAKTDGYVSPDEISATEALIKDLKLSTADSTLAKQFFNKGKQATFDPSPILYTLQKAAGNKPALIRLFVNIQYRIAKIDGLSAEKMLLLNKILSHFRLATLNEQQHFYEHFRQRYQQQEQYQRSSQWQYQHQHQYYQPPPHQQQANNLSQAYMILGVEPTASKETVKKAYRRLMSQYHPDKLMAKGYSEDKIKSANEKTQGIRKAYDTIRASRGW